MIVRTLIAALAALLLCAAGEPVPSPAQLLGRLYHDVEMAQVFPDSKTFADAVPNAPVATILADYARCDCRDRAALRGFVERHFTLPVVSATAPPARRLPLADHIDALWPQLTRTATTAPPGSSALTLPRPFVVPGGRFREMYYWDSWFSMLGLPLAGRQALVEDMIADFGSLIDRYGHIPNGTRSYYLSRSQPPVFYLMTQMSRDGTTLARNTAWLRAEHAWWMRGEAGLRPGGEAARVVRLADGTLLNRYWDDRDDPRDESYREDVLVADAAGRPRAEVLRDLRAGAESGWDFSSRWLGDGRTLATIRTTRLAPVDLNSLMVGLEQTIATNCRRLGDRACAAAFDRRAAARAAAVRRLMWNPKGWFADYDLDTHAPSDGRTAAMLFPLFVGLADAHQARASAVAAAPLVGEGALRTTMVATGQQWDAPNGWAPLQWIAIQGLRRYGERRLAARIGAAWLATVERSYAETGKLLEKYDVAERRAGGGGEYPNQDGFGWTNGVTRALIAEGAR